MESILITIKNSLGIEGGYEGFDSDIILSINTAFMSLTQLGVGPVEGYKIVSWEDTWTDFLGSEINLEGIKSYIQLKVRLLFDPPSSSFVLEAISRQISELEWRLQVLVDPPAV